MPSPLLSYYQSLVTSEYQTAPNFQAWLNIALGRLTDASAVVDALGAAFDLDAATGVQLDALGAIIGQARSIVYVPGLGTLNVNIAPAITPDNYPTKSGNPLLTAGAAPDGSSAVVMTPSNYGYYRSVPLPLNAGGVYAYSAYIAATNTTNSGGVWTMETPTPGTYYATMFQAANTTGRVSSTVTVPAGITQAVLYASIAGTNIGSGGSIVFASPLVTQTAVGPALNATLDDTTYRLLLKARIAQNQWDGTMAGIQSVWQSLFPGGHIAIIDGGNMAATITVSGAFSLLMQDLIANGFIVPRPEGVLYNYSFSALPQFGFDQNSAYIAGFDLGKFAS